MVPNQNLRHSRRNLFTNKQVYVGYAEVLLSNLSFFWPGLRLNICFVFHLVSELFTEYITWSHSFIHAGIKLSCLVMQYRNNVYVLISLMIGNNNSSKRPVLPRYCTCLSHHRWQGGWLLILQSASLSSCLWSSFICELRSRSMPSADISSSCSKVSVLLDSFACLGFCTTCLNGQFFFKWFPLHL